MEYQTVQQKLDCFILTAKISKSRAKEIEAVGEIVHEHKLVDEILANVVKIKRIEDRILTKLDYWICDQLANDCNGVNKNNFSSHRHGMAPSNDQAKATQTWNFNVDTSTGKERPMSREQCTSKRKDIQLPRSMSSAKSRPKKPWKNGRALQQDSISMLAYNAKTPLDVDEGLSTGAILRKSMFSKFGTLNSKRMKMFFKRENNDQDDTKSRKSVKDENPQLSSSAGDKSKSSFFQFRKKGKLGSELHKNVPQNTTVGIENRSKKRRPKSVASCDFDLDDIVIPQGNTENIEDNLPEKEEDQRKAFRDRFRTMPVFYVPTSTKGPLKVFK